MQHTTTQPTNSTERNNIDVIKQFLLIDNSFNIIRALSSEDGKTMDRFKVTSRTKKNEEPTEKWNFKFIVEEIRPLKVNDCDIQESNETLTIKNVHGVIDVPQMMTMLGYNWNLVDNSYQIVHKGFARDYIIYKK